MSLTSATHGMNNIEDVHRNHVNISMTQVVSSHALDDICPKHMQHLVCDLKRPSTFTAHKCIGISASVITDKTCGPFKLADSLTLARRRRCLLPSRKHTSIAVCFDAMIIRNVLIVIRSD